MPSLVVNVMLFSHLARVLAQAYPGTTVSDAHMSSSSSRALSPAGVVADIAASSPPVVTAAFS